MNEDMIGLPRTQSAAGSILHGRADSTTALYLTSACFAYYWTCDAICTSCEPRFAAYPTQSLQLLATVITERGDDIHVRIGGNWLPSAQGSTPPARCQASAQELKRRHVSPPSELRSGLGVSTVLQSIIGRNGASSCKIGDRLQQKRAHPGQPVAPARCHRLTACLPGRSVQHAITLPGKKLHITSVKKFA